MRVITLRTLVFGALDGLIGGAEPHPMLRREVIFRRNAVRIGVHKAMVAILAYDTTLARHANTRRVIISSD